MSSVFLDTDVVLDLYIERQPHHDIALRLFSKLKRTKIRCYTSPIIIANVYYILSKLENREYAMDKIRKLRKLISIAPINDTIIDSAITSPYKDFEDSIQFHCAINNNINIFITRNIRHYPKEQLRVSDPTQYLSVLESKSIG